MKAFVLLLWSQCLKCHWIRAPGRFICTQVVSLYHMSRTTQVTYNKLKFAWLITYSKPDATPFHSSKFINISVQHQDLCQRGCILVFKFFFWIQYTWKLDQLAWKPLRYWVLKQFSNRKTVLLVLVLTLKYIFCMKKLYYKNEMDKIICKENKWRRRIFQFWKHTNIFNLILC